MAHKTIQVSWRGETHPVLVEGNFDGFLDEFALEVGGQLNDERCPFGVLLWPSSRTLADQLALAPRPAKARRVLELGCGVGFLSCVLAHVYPDAEVLACDYETALQRYVEGNARAWGVADRVRFAPIDWRSEPSAELLGWADLVVGADVFYDDSHIMHLPHFAARLLKPGGRLLLADPKRYRFGKALEELKMYFDLLEHSELDCSLEGEGIEEFMVGAGYKEQKISVLELRRR